MLQSLLLVISLCLDTFTASMAYGSSKIKIPFKSSVSIVFTCSLFLALSLIVGDFFKDYLNPNIAMWISFCFLFILGLYRLFEVFFKNYFRKISNIGMPLTFKIFDLKFILEVYADETKADYDHSQILSSKESFYLATALSFDNIAVGFGSSFGNVNYLQVSVLSLIVGMIAILSGVAIGKYFANKSNVDLSWLSGVILILLAILKIL